MPKRQPMSTRTGDYLLTVVALVFMLWASARPQGDRAVLVVGLVLLGLALVVVVRRLRSSRERDQRR